MLSNRQEQELFHAVTRPEQWLRDDHYFWGRGMGISVHQLADEHRARLHAVLDEELYTVPNLTEPDPEASAEPEASLTVANADVSEDSAIPADASAALEIDGSEPQTAEEPTNQEVTNAQTHG